MSQQIGTQTTPLANYPNLADARLFLFGSDTNVDPSILLSDLIQHIRQGFSGSGLTQAEVDARVNAILDAVIPAAKRIPDFTVGDAGEVVVVNATGTGLELAPQSGGSSNELGARASIPATAGFSDGDIINVGGELYELIPSTDAQNVYHGIFSSRESGAYWGDDFIDFGVNPPGNIRAHIPKTGLLTPPATLVIELHSAIDRSHTLYDEFGLARAAAQDTVTTWGYVKNPSDSTRLDGSVVSAGQAFDVSFYTDESKNVAVPIQSASRFAPDKRDIPAVNPIALLGNADRWAKDKLPADVNYGAAVAVTPGRALNTVNPSQNIVATNANAFPTNAPLFMPMVDLDTEPHGEFHLSLELIYTPTGTGTENIGFEQKTNQTADDRTIERSNIIFASAIASQNAIQATSIGITPNGVEAFRIPLYSINTTQGYYNLYITRDSNNQVGYYWFWEASAGSTGGTMTATLRSTFTPADVTTTPKRRTALWATSSTLPTTPFAARVEIPVTWTLSNGSPLTIRSNRLDWPRLRTGAASQCIGSWFVLEVGGTEVAESFIGWRYWDSVAVFPHENSANSRMSMQLDADGTLRIQNINANHNQRANSVIKVYGGI